MTAPTTAGTKVENGVHIYGDYRAPEQDDQKYTDGVLADLFESIAAGNTVRLGEFSESGGEKGALTMTDVLAGQLEELYLALRDGRFYIA